MIHLRNILLTFSITRVATDRRKDAMVLDIQDIQARILSYDKKGGDGGERPC